MAGVPRYVIDEAMCMPSKPKAIEKKKMKGGTYTTKRGGAEACPPQFKGVCCGGAKEWGIKEQDGPGVVDKATGDRNWFCHACGFELDPPADPPIGSKARVELNRRAALRRTAERCM